MLTDCLLVAFLVENSESPDHERVIEKYNVRNTRGSGMLLWFFEKDMDLERDLLLPPPPRVSEVEALG
jgi:hypothetical protein